MEVVNARSALLSNFEVLTHLRELENDYLARSKTAQRTKKEESSGSLSTSVITGEKSSTTLDISENLRTIEVEAIQYLSADFQPTSLQSSAGIARLAKGLAPFELTKAEKLQIVNLAPTAAVELYVIIEELEDRLGGRMDDILALVRASLNAPVSTQDGTQDTERQYPAMVGTVHTDEWVAYEDAETGANDIEFDDTGEGVGVEGDLDMDDD